MSRLPYIDFDALKAKVTIAQVLALYGLDGALKKSGNQLRGCCPIHDGSDKRQFVVYPGTGTWRCYGECQNGGDVIELVSALNGMRPQQAAHDIAERCGFAQEPKSNGNGSRAPRRERDKTDGGDRAATAERVGSPAPSRARSGKRLEPLDYLVFDHDSLVKRNLLSDTAEAFGVGYAPKGIMSGRIAVPFHDQDGTLLAYGGYAIREDQTPRPWKWPKGFDPEGVIFNAHRCRAVEASRNGSGPEGHDPFYITFSPFHVLRLFEDGIENAVALIGEFNPEQADLLDELISGNGYERITVLCKQRIGDEEVVFDHVAHHDVHSASIEWRPRI